MMRVVDDVDDDMNERAQVEPVLIREVSSVSYY